MGRRGFRLAAVVGGATIAAATATGVVLAGHIANRAHAANHTPAFHKATRATPTVSQVEGQLAGVVNAHAAATGRSERIEHVSCITGGPGSYACSFVRTAPSQSGICSVAILRWTPDGDSTYTIVTAGRVALAAAACGPVQKVLHVLGTGG